MSCGISCVYKNLLHGGFKLAGPVLAWTMMMSDSDEFEIITSLQVDPSALSFVYFAALVVGAIVSHMQNDASEKKKLVSPISNIVIQSVETFALSLTFCKFLKPGFNQQDRFFPLAVVFSVVSSLYHGLEEFEIFFPLKALSKRISNRVIENIYKMSKVLFRSFSFATIAPEFQHSITLFLLFASISDEQMYRYVKVMNPFSTVLVCLSALFAFGVEVAIQFKGHHHLHKKMEVFYEALSGWLFSFLAIGVLLFMPVALVLIFLNPWEGFSGDYSPATLPVLLSITILSALISIYPAKLRAREQEEKFSYYSKYFIFNQRQRGNNPLVELLVNNNVQREHPRPLPSL